MTEIAEMATKAALNSPRGIFVSPNNEVYIADYCNHRVRKILENGRIVTIAGTGEYGYSGDNGPATSAQLHSPRSVFVSSRDEVYIADCDNHRIRKILKNGNIVTIAGTGDNGYSGDYDLATKAQLNNPTCVFVTENDQVYIADCYNHRIRKILQNGIIITIAGNGDYGFDNDCFIARKAMLYYPMSIFVSSSEEVYIAEFYNARIRKVLKSGRIETIAGCGKTGFWGDGKLAIYAWFNQPSSVFVTPNNEIYISDTDNFRIRKVLENGNVETIAGSREFGYGGDDGPAIYSKLYFPIGVFVSLSNEVYIADAGNNRIRKVLENGNIVTIAGNGKHGFSGDSPFDILQNPHIGKLKILKPLVICYQFVDVVIVHI